VRSAGVGCSGVSVTWTGTGVGTISSIGDVEVGNRTDDAGIEARSALDLFFNALPGDADIGALVRGGAGAATGVGVAEVASGRLTAAATAATGTTEAAAAGGAAATAGGAAATAGIAGVASAGGAGVALVICAALAAAAVAAPTAAVLAVLADARATSEAASRCKE
jgi:hypothetical protein